MSGLVWDDGSFTEVIQERLQERMTLKQDPLEGGEGNNHVDIWEECSRQGNSKSKGSEAGVCQAYSRNSKEDREDRMQPSKWRVVGGKVKRYWRTTLC